MCYLIAKEFDKKGCIAVKTRHGKALADFTRNLQKQIGGMECSWLQSAVPVPMGNMSLMK